MNLPTSILRVKKERFFRLGKVNVNDFPAGLELSVGDKNVRKTTVKIRRNLLLRFLSMIKKTFVPIKKIGRRFIKCNRAREDWSVCHLAVALDIVDTLKHDV